ncbi:hypothetical protein CVT26_005572 [Gymnopilus dilepis]|uniref:Uncharacterized protein n=1 Tax=Gymnopilus dilepis TaxID=231916 RepID=A0A409XZU5_9AGAR|nr:hypothetical protein CVT26_005572 [Gymnopilus dilepis]
MALAQRLNELAAANAQGLLNDDEYRLLRQNAFEQFSAEPVPPKPRPPSPRLAIPPSQPRGKSTVSSGVVNLFRKATSRRISTPVNDQITTNKDKDSRRNNPSTNGFQSKRSPKLSRLLQKKAAELPALHTDTSSPRDHDVFRSPTSRILVRDGNNSSQLSISSPSGSSEYYAPPLSPSHPEGSIYTMRDIFDDDNLYTAKDISAAIALTEDEAKKLLDAFDNLEATTLRRLQKQNARRLPVTTPTNINVVLEGREWREHRLVSSPSSPLFDNRQRHAFKSTESISDEISLHSGSSHRTNLSQSKSISSLPKLAPSSPLTPQFLTSSRKNSISSLSSQGTSLPTSGFLGVTGSPSLARSTSHAVLRRPKDIYIPPMGSRGSPSYQEHPDDDPELLNIRQRREDLNNRYTARLEFLRAKLKGAELREKLLRK